MIYPRIRALREDNDLTQKVLANHLHITQKSYSRYENGKRGIPTEILVEIADFYGVSIDYMLNRTDNKELQ